MNKIKLINILALCMLIFVIIGCGTKIGDKINNHNIDYLCATATDPIACRELKKATPTPTAPNPNKVFKRLSDDATHAVVMTALNTQSDASIAYILVETFPGTVQVEGYLANLTPTQKAEFYSAVTRTRANSIAANMTVNERAAFLGYWGYLLDNNLVQILAP